MKRLISLASVLALAAGVTGCAGTDALDLTSQTRNTAPATSAQAYTGQTTAMPGVASEFSAPVTSGQTSATTGMQPAAAAQPTPSVAALPANPRVQFAPVIGAAAEAVSPLAEQLFARAGQRGLAVTRQAENANLVVKGYFSTITEGGRTTVIYVWDVLDPSGNRLHRIQGQEIATGGTEEGWASVDGATMHKIADRTIEELLGWMQARRS